MILRNKSRVFQAGGTFALAVCLTGVGIGAGSVTAADTPTPTATATSTTPAPSATSSAPASADATGIRNVSIDTPKAGSDYKVGDPVPLKGTVGAEATAKWNVGVLLDGSDSVHKDIDGSSTSNKPHVLQYEQEGALSLYDSIKASQHLNFVPGYFSEAAWISDPLNPKTDDAKIKQILSIKGEHSDFDVVPALGISTQCGTGMQAMMDKMSKLDGNKIVYFITDGGCGLQEQMIKTYPNITVKTINYKSSTTTACKEGSESVLWATKNNGDCTVADDATKLKAVLAGAMLTTKKVQVTTTGPDGYTNTQDVAADPLGGAWTGKDLTGLKPGKYKSVATATYSDGTTKSSETNFTVTAEATPAPTTTATPTTETPQPTATTETPQPTATTETPKPTATSEVPTPTATSTTQEPKPTASSTTTAPVEPGPKIETDYVS